VAESGRRGTLDTTRDGGIVIATLGGAPGNLLDRSTVELLGGALETFEAPETDLVVITGRGSFFSKGFDVEAIRSFDEPAGLRASLVAVNAVLDRVRALPKPVIAAVNGHCFGGGLELAMACHFRICAEKVRLGLPEVSIGLVPGLGGIHRLARLVGHAKALELIAMGDLITSEEALRLNLVHRVVPKRSFMDHVLSFARTLLMAKPSLFREVAQLLNSADGRSEEENVQAAVDSFVRAFLDS
jgi:enoyl-CoA hydratase/carnithine racemase